ncbi:hypothetical protein LZ838_08460 [Pseudomonas sp. AA27]|uniref:hypothetical protein n=1 Tax=Pseudomonas sp. AA27 TaxID=2908652 RepID=UPI001F26DC23|nr:hypothetical protein [Pseudomonas sp. AA27]MCF1487392.1 hypothetical protein [Pseudomonas sp. AA27]
MSDMKIPFTKVILPMIGPLGGFGALDVGIGQSVPASELFNNLIKQMNADLQQRMSQRSETLNQQAKDTQEGVPSGWEIEFEVTHEEQHWSFDIPSITMRTQTWSFDWPELRGKEASFDVPDGLEWRNERRYLGDFFQCRSITDCGWYPVYADIPVAVVKTKRVTFTVPEVVMERKEFKWDVPEFGVERVDWYVKIPQFKLVRSAATYAEEAERKAEELKTQATAEMKQDILDIRNIYKDQLFQAATAVAEESRLKMTEQYNINLALFNGAIEGMNSQISKLPASEQEKYQVNLNSLMANRQSLIDQYTSFMTNIDAEIQMMVQRVFESLGAAAGL